MFLLSLNFVNCDNKNNRFLFSRPNLKRSNSPKAKFWFANDFRVIISNPGRGGTLDFQGRGSANGDIGHQFKRKKNPLGIKPLKAKPR